MRLNVPIRGRDVKITAQQTDGTLGALRHTEIHTR
jgi:hypothetical protein